MKVLVVTLLLASVVAVCRAGTNCEWGPSYWCKTSTTAQECGRTQYCQDNVWEKSLTSKAEAPQDFKCDICNLVVEFIQKQLDNNATEEQVKEAVLDFCKSLPVGSSECVSFINSSFDQLWNIIVNDGGNAACSTLGLCTSSAKVVPHPLKQTPPKKTIPGGCTVCKAVAKELLKMAVNNATETFAKVEIKKVCVYMGGFASMCREVIDSYFNEIWDAATKKMSPEAICAEIKLCVSSRLGQMTFMAKPKAPEQPLCDVCQLVVSFVKPYVDNNNTEEEVKDALETVCGLLPGNLSSECTTLVDTYFDLVWMLLKAEVDSGEVCKQIGLCNTTSTSQPLLKAVPQPKKPQDEVCDACKLASTFLKHFVDENSTEAEAKALVLKVCSILPSEFAPTCNATVNQYFDQIWDLLKQEVDSGSICEQIGLCTSLKKVKVSTDPPFPPNAPCDVCRALVVFLKPFLNNNATENEVRVYVNNSCLLLSKNVTKECQEIFDFYFNDTWEYLKNIVNDDICDELVCSGAVRRKVREPMKFVGGSGTCAACQMVVKYLKEIVDNNVAEAEALALVKGVCKEAGAMKDECDSMVESYFPMLWKLVQSYVDDDQICTEIKLCANTPSVQSLVKVQNQKPAGVFCMVCEYVMKELTSKLDTNATKQAVQKALDEVCGELPSSFKDDCTHFVDKYGPEIIDLIVSGVAGKAVCTALGLCVLEEEQMVASQGTEGNCDVCKVALNMVKLIIGSKDAETKLDEVLEKVCILVPKGIRGECNQFIDTYGPELLQLLEKDLDPDTICADLKLCSKARLTAME